MNVQFTSAILATRTDKILSHRSYDSLPFSGKESNSGVPKKNGASQNVPLTAKCPTKRTSDVLQGK